MEITNTILKQLFNSNERCITAFVSHFYHAKSIPLNGIDSIELNARLFSSDKCYDVHESVSSMNTTHQRH